MALSREEVQRGVHFARVANLGNRLRLRRALEAVADELLASARTAQLADGRVFTGVPLGLALELALHQEASPDDTIFVAVDERHLRRFAVALGRDDWQPEAIQPLRLVPEGRLSAGELNQWMERTGRTPKSLSRELGVTEEAVRGWSKSKYVMSEKNADRIRALMAEVPA